MLESKNLQDGRDQVRSECWENDGHSAEKIVDYLEEKLKENAAIEPVEITKKEENK